MHVAMVTLKNRTLSPVVERFMECAHEVTKSFVDRKLASCHIRSFLDPLRALATAISRVPGGPRNRRDAAGAAFWRDSKVFDVLKPDILVVCQGDIGPGTDIWFRSAALHARLTPLIIAQG
jgi:hypothetical protein